MFQKDFSGWCRIVREGPRQYEEWEVRHLRDPKGILFFDVRAGGAKPSILLRRVLLPNVWHSGKSESNKIISRAFRFLEYLHGQDEGN